MPEVNPLFDAAPQPGLQPIPQPVPPHFPVPVPEPEPATPPHPVHIGSVVALPAASLPGASLPTDADIDHLTQDARAGYASVTEKLLATHKTADMGDMVTQAMTQAAQTLGDNSIQIATMQQQAIIGTDTLEQCQTILEQSAAKVHEIEAQGAAQRQIDEGKRAGLERRLMGGA